MKKRVLWISPYVPYDSIRHAGGKIENFYIKGLKANLEDASIELISFCEEWERELVDLNRYGISYDIEYVRTGVIPKIKRIIRYNCFESKFSPFNKYGNYVSNYFRKVILNKLKRYKKRNEQSPDVIILQWTSSVMLISEIKKMFPNSKYIAIEEDVTFLSFQRQIEMGKTVLERTMKKLKYERVKEAELRALNNSDIIICNNNKDQRLLLESGIMESKIEVWCPYFYDFSNLKRSIYNKNIVFYGAMNRIENHMSAVWFIENVVPKIEHLGVKFIVVGAHPMPELKKYESNSVKVLGFVDDIGKYLNESLCLVAPLVLGAGIKIKVLEAMSAGLPVVTNEIGIEGIPANNGKEYCFCESPKEYSDTIARLLLDEDYNSYISSNAVKFMQSNFNINSSLDRFVKLVDEL